MAVGSPEAIVQRLREQLAREIPPHQTQVKPVKPVDQAKQASQALSTEPRRKITRKEVLAMMEGRADQLHPVTQVSRLNRRLSMEHARSRGGEK